MLFIQLVAMHQSCGGMSGDGSQSYAATVLSAAKVKNSTLFYITYRGSFCYKSLFCGMMQLR